MCPSSLRFGWRDQVLKWLGEGGTGMIQKKEDQKKFNRIIELVNEYNPGKVSRGTQEEDQDPMINIINNIKYNI